MLCRRNKGHLTQPLDRHAERRLLLETDERHGRDSPGVRPNQIANLIVTHSPKVAGLGHDERVRRQAPMEILDRGRPPHALRSGGADLVAAVQLVENQFLGVRRARARLYRVWAVLMIANRHVEEVVRGLGFVGQDERPHTRPMRDAPVEPPLDVG